MTKSKSEHFITYKWNKKQIIAVLVLVYIFHAFLMEIYLCRVANREIYLVKGNSVLKLC